MSLARRVYRTLNPAPPPAPFIESEAYRARVSLYESLSVAGCTVMIGDSMIDFCPWAEMMNQPLLNRGIAGDRVEGMAKRLPAIMVQEPRAIIALCGINDLLDGKQANHLIEMFESIPSSVYVTSILPTDRREINDQIRLVNLALSSRARFIDAYSAFEKNGAILPDLTCDGIHLSVSGYLLLATIFSAQVPA